MRIDELAPYIKPYLSRLCVALYSGDLSQVLTRYGCSQHTLHVCGEHQVTPSTVWLVHLSEAGYCPSAVDALIRTYMLSEGQIDYLTELCPHHATCSPDDTTSHLTVALEYTCAQSIEHELAIRPGDYLLMTDGHITRLPPGLGQVLLHPHVCGRG